jgi:hypothetical protein
MDHFLLTSVVLLVMLAVTPATPAGRFTPA